MRPCSSLFLCLALLLAGSAGAADITLQNDGFVDGASVGFQGGFVAGEIGAVRLHPPDATPRLLKKVQFLFGGAAGTRNVDLHIYNDAGLTTNPGSELFTGTYQVTASNVALQEIDVSAANIMVTGPIRVGLEFSASGTPCIARDGDGTITASRNYILADGFGWLQSSLFGLTGDWIIRAIVGDAVTSYTVGGTVSGLSGTLVLQNNGGDDLVVNANGPFTFATALSNGAGYNVTVLSEPAGQDCVVLNGNGVIASGNVTNVAVNCTATGSGTLLVNDGFLPGGVAGFQGGFVAGEIAAARLHPPDATPRQLLKVQFLFGGAAGIRDIDLHIYSDAGLTTAPGSELYTATYQVTASDSALQEIDLSAASIMVTGPVRVGIEFSTSGLPCVARDDDGTITANRNYVFASGLGWVTSASLGLTGDWIIRAFVGDPVTAFSVGGTVSGLSGTLVLQNNGGDNLVVNADGPFTFANSLSNGASYNVSVLSEPAGQDCVVVNGIGTISGSNVSNVIVNCSATGSGTLLVNDGFLPGGVAGFQGGFVAGEIAAARLHPPDATPRQLQKVQFLFGGAAGTRDIDLHIYNDAGLTTAPGTELHTATYQVTASDSALQEIDLSGLGITISGPIRVGIEFTTSGLPCVARDDDGTITTNRNYVFASGIGWVTSASLGLTGDWIIRAVIGGAVVGVEAPQRRTLSLSAAPNPFNPATSIFYELPAAGAVRMQLFDSRGRLVETLLDGVVMPAGQHRFAYRSELASGSYLLRIESGRHSEALKLSLVR